MSTTTYNIIETLNKNNVFYWDGNNYYGIVNIKTDKHGRLLHKSIIDGLIIKDFKESWHVEVLHHTELVEFFFNICSDYGKGTNSVSKTITSGIPIMPFYYISDRLTLKWISDLQKYALAAISKSDIVFYNGYTLYAKQAEVFKPNRLNDIHHPPIRRLFELLDDQTKDLLFFNEKVTV